MTVPERGLVTGRQSHQVYLIENGNRRWVPDLWTMHDLNMSPAEMVIVSDDDLLSIPEGAPVHCTVPKPSLEGISYVESDLGVFRVDGDRLVPLTPQDAALVRTEEGFDAQAFAESVAFLPLALVRAFLDEEANR